MYNCKHSNTIIGKIVLEIKSQVLLRHKSMFSLKVSFQRKHDMLSLVKKINENILVLVGLNNGNTGPHGANRNENVFVYVFIYAKAETSYLRKTWNSFIF